MSKLLQRVELSLRSFYIFNSNFGNEEGEEYKKILYYYPNDIELDTKIKDVGLSIAITAFTGTFTSEDDCKAMHTQKTTQIFYQPEPGYWMVLVINVPKEIRTKDGVEVAEYRGGEVHDRVYRAVLEQCYNMFRFFEGTFQMNYNVTSDNGNDAAREQLSKTLTTFFDKYLPSVKLTGCDFIDVVRSLQYLPLNKCLFLRAHNFVSMIQSTFPAIKEIIFLYNNQVVCSGKMNPVDLYSLHEYIVNTLMPEITHTEPSNPTLHRSDSTISEKYRNGAFITGSTVDGAASIIKPPKVYLRNEDTQLLESYYLIVYRALNAKLCLFIDVLDEPQSDLYTELHSYMGPQLTSIARDIGDVLEKIQNTIKQAQLCAALSTVPTIIDPESSAIPKFLFINEQSLKHLSNMSTDKSRLKTIHSIPTNVMNLIADFGSDISDFNNSSVTDSAAFEELQVKTTNDFWIVKRRSNWRQYYVIISNSKATLLEITHEAKRIFEQELTDDVLFDQ